MTGAMNSQTHPSIKQNSYSIWKVHPKHVLNPNLETHRKAHGSLSCAESPRFSRFLLISHNYNPERQGRNSPAHMRKLRSLGGDAVVKPRSWTSGLGVGVSSKGVDA